jgi:hypothetical protein
MDSTCFYLILLRRRFLCAALLLMLSFGRKYIVSGLWRVRCAVPHDSQFSISLFEPIKPVTKSFAGTGIFWYAYIQPVTAYDCTEPILLLLAITAEI